MKNKDSKKTILHFTLSLCILIFAFCIFAAKTASAASLYFYPQNIDMFEGESAVIEVRLNTEGETINALELNGRVSDGLSINSIDTSNSLIQIFVEAPKAENGTFRFVGGVPKGFSGSGIIGRLTVTPTRVGSGEVSFKQIKVLANSERAEEVQTRTLTSTINTTVKPKDYIKLSSRTNPIQTNWYAGKDVNIHWDLVSGAEYSYLVSQDQTAVPDDTPDKPSGTMMWQGDIALNDLSDGIYYFSVKKVGSVTVSRYSILRDNTLPEWVSVKLNKGDVETSGKEYVSFLAKDTTSGIDRYEIKVDNEEFKTVQPPNYVIEKPDYKRIVIRAYDKAGNVIEESIETKGRDYTSWIGAIFVILVMIGMFLISQRRIRR